VGNAFSQIFGPKRKKLQSPPSGSADEAAQTLTPDEVGGAVVGERGPESSNGKNQCKGRKEELGGAEELPPEKSQIEHSPVALCGSPPGSSAQLIMVKVSP